MKKKLLILTVFIFFLSTFLISNLAMAATAVEEGLNSAATKSGLATDEQKDQSATELVQARVGQVLQILLGMLGIIFLVLTIYGGALYMFPGGKEDNTKKGRSYIIYAGLGLLIVALSYAIASFVMGTLAPNF
jgi:hypothetical protein